MSFNGSLSLSQGAMGLYCRGPESADAPAVIVLQEIFGVNDNIRSTVDYLAGEGFYAVAPDLFWRAKPGVDLNPDDPESRATAMELSQAYDVAAGTEDLRGLVTRLREAHCKVALMGYCIGGRMAFISWLKLDLDAVVSYYGVNLVPLLDEAQDQATPLLMHIGKDDPLNPPDAQKAISEALNIKFNVSLNIYPDVGHAFARRNANSYVAHAAEQADALTLNFLRKHVG